MTVEGENSACGQSIHPLSDATDGELHLQGSATLEEAEKKALLSACWDSSTRSTPPIGVPAIYGKIRGPFPIFP